MAHPQKSSAVEGHNAKLRRMTTHYGSADPSANIAAPQDGLKQEGPEDAVSFGADSSQPRARADRAGRSKRTSAANPVSTYRKGGRVKKRADGGTADVSTIEEANRDQAMANPPGRARGGRMKHGKGTHVNVIVAPQGAGGPGAGAMPPPVIAPPGMGAAPPPAMPPRPPMMPPGAGMPPGGPMPMPPGMPPPGMMPPRAKGGRVHADAKEDKDLIMKTLRDEGLTRADHEVKRARGGKITSIHDMTAGSMSGEGREQKIELQKHAGNMKKQAV